MMKILKSRKFVMTVLTALVLTLNRSLGLGLDENTLTQLVAVVVGYILGESAIDAAHAWGGQSASGKNQP